MATISTYFRLLRLKCSNSNLLRIYAFLSRMEHNDQELLTALEDRTSLRKNIEEELKNLLTEMDAKNGAILNSFCTLCSNGVKIEFLIYDTLREYHFKSCFKCELKNINQYYNVLYAVRSQRTLVDILLTQKNHIENYLLKEM